MPPGTPGYISIRETDLMRRLTIVEDQVWAEVLRWDPFERDTVGKQLASAIDSVGANLCEGDGRFSTPDGLRFFYIARGSLEEAKFWLERCRVRLLSDPEKLDGWLTELAELAKMLNGMIRYRRTTPASQVREQVRTYGDEQED